MNKDRILRQPSYLGKVYLINAVGGSIIATGQGQFDTVNLKLRTHFENVTLGRYEGVVIVLETSGGYFAPMNIFSQTIIPVVSRSDTYSMSSFLHWPINLPVDYIVQQFSSFTISTKARHFPDEYQPDTPSNPIATITKQAINKDLEDATHEGFSVHARSTFHTIINHDNVDNHAHFAPLLAFQITSTQEKDRFTLRDIHKLLSAFRVYWINSHDYVDCTVVRIALGEMQCFIPNASFGAVSRNSQQYRPALDINDPLELEFLAKLTHFYMNPTADKDKGSSSKVGLAFGRITARRYKRQHETVDYQVIDLIFSLQSMAESVAQKEITRQNKEVATETKEAIEKIRGLVRSIKAELPKNVRDFYLQKSDKTYAAVTRPTFMRSVEIAFKKLHITLKDHLELLKEIDEARRQVVHSEKYDGQFILDLLTRGVTTFKRDQSGNVTSVAFSIKTGTLDRLYELLKEMLRAYLEQYDV